MSSAIEFVLNGRPIRVEDCSPNTTLLEYLRHTSLTGAKEGCAEGDCGACSVVLVERNTAGQPAYRAINSCLTPLCLVAGREIITVEGLAREGRLHPVQAKMVEGHGSQCGYCTPGVVMSLFEGFYRGSFGQEEELKAQLAGNLCRCTGYRPIREAALACFREANLAPKKGPLSPFQGEREKPSEPCGKPGRLNRRASEAVDQRADEREARDGFAERLKQTAPSLGPVEYECGGERFLRPVSLLELLEVRDRFPEGRLIAGATELGLEISKRFKTFPVLISVEAVPELKEIRATDSEWHIGAAVTLTEIEEKLVPELPALGDMLHVFGSRQIRNRATMGGNLVTASPIGDSAPVLLALDAKVVLVALRGGTLSERTLPIDEFFVGYRKTALRAGEILKTIILPRLSPARRLCWWYKVSKRREMDISTVSACFRVELDADAVVQAARLAYGGVAAMPARARRAEQALIGKPWNEKTVQGLLPILREEFTPISDVRGSADYRRGLITSLFEKFFWEGARTPRPRAPMPAA